MSASNSWSPRQAFRFMSFKVKVDEGVSFDDVIEAMQSIMQAGATGDW